jgi:hydrogenase nickel incorporation protein HypA/HybF
MHELGIANSIIETVQNEMLRYPMARPQRVGIRIGALAAVDASALQFCFEVVVHDTEFRELKLEVEIRPRRHRCGNCAMEFSVMDYDFQCPRCGNFAPDCIGGDELELAFLEVEDHEPSTA